MDQFRMDRFISLISERFSLSNTDLYDMWYACGICKKSKCGTPCIGQFCKKHQRCTFELTHGVRKGKPCSKPAESDSLCELHKEPPVLCPILLQSGAKKHKACHKICAKGQTSCQTHEGLKMCPEKDCTKTTVSNLCLFHQKELERKKNREKPKIQIRFSAPYFILKNTNIVIDPSLNVILGILDQDTLKPECTPEVQHACKTFQLRFHN